MPIGIFVAILVSIFGIGLLIALCVSTRRSYIVKDIKTKPIKHHHLVVRAEVQNPPKEEDKEALKIWFKELIELIGMKLLSGPHVEYVGVKGNEGLTGVCIIETSHMAMHVWEATNPPVIQLDVYSCDCYDPNIVLKHFQVFEPSYITASFIDRETREFNDLPGLSKYVNSIASVSTNLE